MNKCHNFRILSVFYLLIALIAPVTTQALTNSMLVAPVMSQNMVGTDPVLRFSFQGTGSVSPLSTIEPPAVVNSQSVTFNGDGELFVGNRHDNFSPASISRFKFSNDGSFSPNGVITGNGIQSVAGVAFSPSGELFATNYVPGNVSRFLFNSNDNAVPNGKFAVGYGVQGLTFNKKGELFVARDKATSKGVIYRYTFDLSGNPVLKGIIPAEFGQGPHGIAFSPAGELFVPDLNGYVHRFLFNSIGDAVPNGSIAAPMKLVIGVAFSQSGEMFLTGIVNSSKIYRYLFDTNGNAIAHGQISTAEVGFGMPAIYPSALSYLPFANFIPRASLNMGMNPNDDAFKVSAKFNLGKDSDGIDPLTENVTLKMGNFAITIPAGKFEQFGSDYRFEGIINKINLKAEIHAANGHSKMWGHGHDDFDYLFKLRSKNTKLNGLSVMLPPSLQLTIGDDMGQAKLDVGEAKFGKGKDGGHWLSEDD